MSTQILQTIVVSGINDGDELCEISMAWHKAHLHFEHDLISPLTSVGHNFVQSFCIFPSGGSRGREPQQEHQQGITAFVHHLSRTGLEYVAVQMPDDVHDASIISASTQGPDHDYRI